jgi:DNA-binding NarL/FixJ family response regulator
MRHLQVDALILLLQHRPMPEIRVVLGDEHRSFVEALAIRLEAESGLFVMAAVSEPEEALRAVRGRPVDVAVLSVDGGPDGFLGVSRRLLQVCPELKLVAVTSTDQTSTLARAVQEGFRAWVPKDVGICVLLDVLHAVCRGETWIPPRQLTRLLQHLLRQETVKRAAEAPLAALTAREHQVLRAMSSGATRDEIARRLSISSNTVRTHTQSILNKLGVHTSLAAVTVARRAGVA